jgi:hypothetical protein
MSIERRRESVLAKFERKGGKGVVLFVVCVFLSSWRGVV